MADANTGAAATIAGAGSEGTNRMIQTWLGGRRRRGASLQWGAARRARNAVAALSLAFGATVFSAPAAQAAPVCDVVRAEVFHKSFHAGSFPKGTFNNDQAGLVLACDQVYTITPSLRLLAGYGAMTFRNSHYDRSFGAGVDFELQYRPEFLGNFGVFLGGDAGFMTGYQGHVPQAWLWGPFRAAGMMRVGALWDIPDTNISAHTAFRFIPSPFGASFGTVSVGMTYQFEAAEITPLVRRPLFSSKSGPIPANMANRYANTRF
jgi:hypothetical protein